MIRDQAKQDLSSGRPLLGWFRPADTKLDADPGVLSWSGSNGARLELLDTTANWPKKFSDETFTVHGELRDGSDVTLLKARVKTFALFNVAQTITSSGIALGEQTSLDERWPRASFGTHNLYPWRDSRGLKVSRPNRRARPDHLRYDWQPPPQDEVRVKGATLTFTTQMRPDAGSEKPSWSISTEQRVVVTPDRRFTFEQAARRYAIPLVSLTSFAANKPDAITHEAYWDLETRRRIEVWQMGREGQTPSWRPGRDRLLVAAHELRDFAKAIRRWWRLHEKVWPALGIYGDYVGYGSSYSPARFLTLYSAVEGYCKSKHGHKSPKKLRGWVGVPGETVACDNSALALIGESRNYFAHLGEVGKLHARERVENGAFDSTRRLEALMQAALLRELGFSPPDIKRLLTSYYARWPLPGSLPR